MLNKVFITFATLKWKENKAGKMSMFMCAMIILTGTSEQKPQPRGRGNQGFDLYVYIDLMGGWQGK